MSPLSSPRGTAEELQRVLDGDATSQEAARHARLVRTVGLLTSHPVVEPSVEFSADLRARLMDAAETELVPDRTAVVRALRPVGPARRRAGAVAASLVIIGGTAGVAAAAGSALPGDALYPVKRGTEQVGTSLSLGASQKGRSELAHATTRLQEARELQADGGEQRLVTGALRSFRESASAGSAQLFSAYDADQRYQDVAAVRDFAAAQMVELEAMSAEADPRVAAVLVDAADTLADLDQQARQLCSECSDAPDLVTPTAVAAGSGAATVDALLTRPVAQAQVDREAMQAMAIDEIRTLSRLAEQSADDLAAAETLRESVPPVEVDQHGPVTSTLTGGSALPAPSDRPVRDLVDGVTGTVRGVTGTVRSALPRTGTAVDDVTEALDDTIAGVTGGLAP